MLKTKSVRFVAVVTGAVLAFGLALPAGAQTMTVAQLLAQINALTAQLNAVSGGSSASATFSANLTVGSKGADVTALQNWLINKGGSIPAGATGYFGLQTKAAVAAWQASAGISPAAGYFGPISRAAANAMAVTPPVGFPPVVVPPTTGITTPGAEGTLTVTTGTLSDSTVYANDTMVSILAFKAKAQNSDIALQRVKLDLGTASSIYSKVYSKIYLVNAAGQVLVSSDLNSTTVVKDGSIYYITLTGFSSVVAKGATTDYTIKVDVRDVAAADAGSKTVRLAANGVRGVDGAGIDQYSPANATDVSKAVTAAVSLAGSATLALSTAASTPLTQEVVAAGGSGSDEADKVAILSFNLRAEKDNVIVTDLVATVSRSAGAATASTTYLYAGNTLISSASAALASVTFSDIDYTISKDTTQVFTLKSDIRSAGGTQTTITASVANADLTTENSLGDSVIESGSATSNSILVRNVGPMFTLVSAGTPTYTAGLALATGTSTAKATFVVNIKAVGDAINFGTQAASSTFAVGTYKGAVLGGFANSSTTNFVIPSSGVTTSGILSTDAFRIEKGENANVTMEVIFPGRLTTGVLLATDGYAFGLDRISWSTATAPYTLLSSTFMAGKTEWRTSTVTMP